jgi:hypothetical protein
VARIQADVGALEVEAGEPARFGGWGLEQQVGQHLGPDGAFGRPGGGTGRAVVALGAAVAQVEAFAAAVGVPEALLGGGPVVWRVVRHAGGPPALSDKRLGHLYCTYV